jgi:hypothetical protein
MKIFGCAVPLFDCFWPFRFNQPSSTIFVCWVLMKQMHLYSLYYNHQSRQLRFFPLSSSDRFGWRSIFSPCQRKRGHRQGMVPVTTESHWEVANSPTIVLGDWSHQAIGHIRPSVTLENPYFSNPKVTLIPKVHFLFFVAWPGNSFVPKSSKA